MAMTPEQPEEDREIEKLLIGMVKTNASDMHLKADAPPLFRVNGAIVRAKLPPLQDRKIRKLVDELLTRDLRDQLQQQGSADFSHAVKGYGRFRINVFFQRNSMSVAVRRVESNIPTLNSLNLPESLAHLTQTQQGLILSAGITGSGKSTTLAALLNLINQTRPVHVVTIEDPIEYTYTDEKAIFNQREVGIDVPNFAEGLRYVLRQDPDVILIGEMRDAETFETALMATETGHLVFGTIHSRTASQTINRVLDYFPHDRHHQIRQLLFFNLRAIIVQKLIPSLIPEFPRVPAVEIMICNAVIQKLISEGQDAQITNAIRSFRAEGMQDFNQSLHELVKRGMIAPEVALQNSLNPEQLRMNLKGITLSTDEGAILGSL